MMTLSPGHPNTLILGGAQSASGDQCTWAKDPANQSGSPIWSMDGSNCAASATWDGQSTGYAASSNGQVWAFDMSTGKILWQSSYPTDPSGESGGYPEIYYSDGLVAINVWSQGVLNFPGFSVFRADNGQQIPNLTADTGDLQDGILATCSYNAGVWNVYVPSFS